MKKVEDFDLRRGIIKVFKPPVPAETYTAYTDPSMGREDPFHTHILLSRTKEEVCNAHGMFPADEVAVIHDYLCRKYNNARNSYELNAIAGGVFKAAIDKLGTPNRVPKKNSKGEITGGYGDYMTNPLKKDRLGKLRSSIFNREPIIHDASTIDELNTMIWEEGEDMPEVPGKMHDDRIMALAGAIDIASSYKAGSCKVVSHIPDSEGWYK